MTEEQKDKMIVTIKELSRKIQKAEGVERVKLMVNRDFLMRQIMEEFGATELITSGIMDDFIDVI